jgi:ABC-type bacteriocin/lantibiotic exporter with double-glycine peptidase domain
MNSDVPEDSALKSRLARTRLVGNHILRLLGRRRAVLMLASSLVMSASEAAGIALLFPLIQMIVDRPFYLQMVALGGDLTVWLRDTQGLGIAAFSAALAVFYVVRATVHTRLLRYQADTAADLTADASHQTISNALAARYRLFQVHSAAEIAGISYGNATHAALVLQAAMGFVNEAIFLAFMFIGLLIINPLVVSTLLVVAGLLAFVLLRPFSQRAAEMGRRVQEVDMARHRYVFSMATAVRDIKIMALETPFIQRNHHLAQVHAHVTARYAAMSGSLRLIIETTMLVSVSAVCAWVGLSGTNLLDLAPLLGTLTLLVARAVPALSRLSMNINAVRYSWPMVERLQNINAEMVTYKQTRLTGEAPFPAEYAGEKLSFHYGAAPAVEDVSIRIPQGAAVVISGPSGSGKSTLLDLLTGLQQPSKGTFTLGGKAFDPFQSSAFSERVGYVPQAIALFDASLEYNIALEDDPDPERLERAVRASHLDPVVAQMPGGLKTLLGTGGQGVSGGQRQRIGIARALYRQPALLVLDEVTSALDGESKRAVIDELLELRGSTSLLFVTHDLTHLEDVDLYYRMDAGRLQAVERPTNG